MSNCACGQKRKIFEALYKTQDACKGIEADAKSSGPSKHEYLSLKGIYNAVKPVLKENGLFVHHLQVTEPTTGKQIQQTIIRHRESNEEIIDERYLVPDKPGCQGAGAAETYHKRYALVSMIGIATGENDDDGESGRAYFERVKALQQVIKEHAQARALYIALLNHFKIKEFDELGDAGLFDALLFSLKFKQ